MQSENTLTSGASNVTYTRTTTVSPAGLNLATYSPTSGKSSNTTTALNMVLMTVTVNWVYRGTTYSTSMSTLRAQDH